MAELWDDAALSMDSRSSDSLLQRLSSFWSFGKAFHGVFGLQDCSFFSVAALLGLVLILGGLELVDWRNQGHTLAFRSHTIAWRLKRHNYT
jgi:hypothetical protein